MPAPWQSGDTVVLRYRKRGRPLGAFPTRAIATGAQLVLWLAPGTVVKWPAIDGRHAKEVDAVRRYETTEWGTVDRRWVGDGILILGRTDRAHALWLFWDEGRFAGWYVNLEARWRQTPIGFDTADHELDLWVAADGSWAWKDEDDLAIAVRHGYFTAEEAAGFRAEGERVLEEWPFPTGWEDWRPEPDWPLPRLPEAWNVV